MSIHLVFLVITVYNYVCSVLLYKIFFVKRGEVNAILLGRLVSAA